MFCTQKTCRLKTCRLKIYVVKNMLLLHTAKKKIENARKNTRNRVWIKQRTAYIKLNILEFCKSSVQSRIMAFLFHRVRHLVNTHLVNTLDRNSVSYP